MPIRSWKIKFYSFIFGVGFSFAFDFGITTIFWRNFGNPNITRDSTNWALKLDVSKKLYTIHSRQKTIPFYCVLLDWIAFENNDFHLLYVFNFSFLHYRYLLHAIIERVNQNFCQKSVWKFSSLYLGKTIPLAQNIFRKKILLIKNE